MNRENKNYNKSSIRELKINGTVTSDKKKIEETVSKYFSALFNGHHDRQGNDSDYSGCLISWII